MLVVDDESSLSDLLSMALRYEGWEVRAAADGRTGDTDVTTYVPMTPAHVTEARTARVLRFMVAPGVRVVLRAHESRATCLSLMWGAACLIRLCS